MQYFKNVSTISAVFQGQPFLVYTSLGCGGILKGRRGSIQTPGYPSGYQNNVKCDWNVQVQPHYSVNFKNAVVSLPPASQQQRCNKDFVSVHEGTNSSGNELFQLCGVKEYKDINTKYNELFVTFQSDDVDDGSDFKGALTEYNTGLFVVLCVRHLDVHLMLFKRDKSIWTPI